MTKQHIVDMPPSRVNHYSLLYLMLLISAAAVGLAIATLEPFRVSDGFFAVATMLIGMGLVREVMELRRNSPRHVPNRRYQITWRCCLLIGMIGYFVLVSFRQSAPGWSYEGSAYAPESMLLLAFFSCLTMNSPPRQNRGYELPMLILATCVLLLLVYANTTIVFLVQVAIEMMEMSGPASQYAIGHVYEGLDPDLRSRSTRFAFVSGWGLVPLIGLVPSLLWVASRFQRQLTNRGPVLLLLALLVTTAIYPLWLMMGGLWHFSPTYAEASLRFGWVSAVSGAYAVLLLTLLLTYRQVAFEVADVWGELPQPTYSNQSIVTLAALGMASTVWLGGRILAHASGYLEWADIIITITAEPVNLIALATLMVTGRRLVLWSVGRFPTPVTVIARAEPKAIAVIFPAMMLTILLIPPILWWFVYSWTVVLYRHS